MTIMFSKLWTNHPALKGTIYPCATNGRANFSNQCAIRMGVCLENSGISLRSFKGAKCYPGHGHSQKHILRAEELAGWLEKQEALFGQPSKKRKVSSKHYASKKGIVLLKNFWGTGNQGDHIDLWNGVRLAHGAPGYFSASQEVWFWALT